MIGESKTGGGIGAMSPLDRLAKGLEGERQPQVAIQLSRLDQEIMGLEELFNSLEKKLAPVLNMNNVTPNASNDEIGKEERMVDIAQIIRDKTKRIQGVNRALSYVLQNIEI